jgi:membrane dipeptidase
MIRFFDAHCDTLRKVAEGEADFFTGQGDPHISLPGLLKSGSCVQVFAIWVYHENYPGEEFKKAESLIHTARAVFEQSRGLIRPARTREDIKKACDGEGLVAVLSLEGADPLQGNPENLFHFRNLGVRSVLIAWGDNAFAGTVFGEGYGLTRQGASLIEIAEGIGIVLDVSHLSDRAFMDFYKLSTKPFIASHSNCRSICPSPRNLTDEMIRRIADRGGVAGINLASGFLSPDSYATESVMLNRFLSIPKDNTEQFDKALKEFETTVVNLPRPPMDWIARHVQHMIKTGGEDCVGLGGDLDGVPSLPSGIDGINDYPVIAHLLLRSGLTESQVEKVCWKNFERVFTDIMS